MADAREGWLSSIVSTMFLIFTHSSKRSATPFFVGFGSCSSCGRNHLRKSTQRNPVVLKCNDRLRCARDILRLELLPVVFECWRRCHRTSDGKTPTYIQTQIIALVKYSVVLCTILYKARRQKKQNTIKIGVFKQFTFALWQTETGMKFPECARD